MPPRSAAEKRYEVVVIVLAALAVLHRLAEWRNGWPDLSLLAIVSLLLVPLAVRTQITISRGQADLTLGASAAALFSSGLSHPQTILPIWALLICGSYAVFYRDETWGMFRAAIQVLGGAALLWAAKPVDIGLRPYDRVFVGLLAYFAVITALEMIRRLFVPPDEKSGERNILLALRWATVLLVGTGVFYVSALLAVLRRLYEGIPLPVIATLVVALVGAFAVSIGLGMRLRQLWRSVATLSDAAVTMPWPGEEIDDILRMRSLQAVRSYDVRVSPGSGERWDFSVPLVDGRFLVASRTRGDLPFSVVERNVLEALANMAATSRAASAQLDQLLERATTDALTGLSTYTHFRDRLEQISAERDPGESLAIVFIDLDGFKDINDRYGHLVGDEAIREIAVRLSHVDGPDSLVTRFGGDEFALLVRDVRDFTHLEDVLNRIGFLVARPISVGADTLRLRASMGAALSASADDSVEELVRAADLQMYHRKRAIHADDAEVTLRIDEAVRDAIRERRIGAAYQPIVGLESGLMHSVEVLVRYDDPVLGSIPPPTIVSSAQRLNLLDDMTGLLLEHARETMRLAMPYAPGLRTVGINVEIGQIGTWTRLLEEMTACQGEDGVALVIEISERSIGWWSQANTTIAARLRKAGVLLAIDDFGAGRASLGSLHAVRGDVVKIDRSLLQHVEDPRQQMILHRVTEMLVALEVDVVVEGIEDEHAASIVQGFGATHGQGLWFGAAMSRDDLLARVREHGDAAIVRSSS